MSKFEVLVTQIDEIKPIDWADTLEIAQVGGYQCVVPKGKFSPKQKIAYIPESSLLPVGIVEEMGLTGKLAGPDKNRVKAIKLRGVLSEGLVYDLPMDAPLGEDVAELLGITKYEPVIPVCMSGKVIAIDTALTVAYDIEPLRKYPDMFGEIDEVVITEKIHGTCIQIGILKGFTHPEFFGKDKNIYVASKGLAAQGMVYGTSADNVYTKMLLSILPQMEEISDSNYDSVYMMGEVYGRGVQDLHYNSDVSIRFFDVKYRGHWISPDSKYKMFSGLGLASVPVLYDGNFKKKLLEDLINIESRVGGKGHILEGLVITAKNPDARHPRIGRPIVKYISDAYLSRKDGTEYN
jgi:RNA ligase (TIGR02306 family)